MTHTPKPIRVVFTKNGQPRHLPISGKIDEKLWTAGGHHWLKSDGPFPYDNCETRHIELHGGLSILSATPN